MESERLMRILPIDNAVDAIGMILSNHADFGHESGCLLSVKRFDDAANDIIVYFALRSISSGKEATECSHADEYQATRRPTCGCIKCRDVYIDKLEREAAYYKERAEGLELSVGDLRREVGGLREQLVDYDVIL